MNTLLNIVPVHYSKYWYLDQRIELEIVECRDACRCIIASALCGIIYLAHFTRLYTVQRGTLLVAQLVEALRYKPEGRGFDSRWCIAIFH